MRAVLADALGGPVEHQAIAGLGQPLGIGPSPSGLLPLRLNRGLGGHRKQFQSAEVHDVHPGRCIRNAQYNRLVTRVELEQAIEWDRFIRHEPSSEDPFRHRQHVRHGIVATGDLHLLASRSGICSMTKVDLVFSLRVNMYSPSQASAARPAKVVAALPLYVAFVHGCSASRQIGRRITLDLDYLRFWLLRLCCRGGHHHRQQARQYKLLFH